MASKATFADLMALETSLRQKDTFVSKMPAFTTGTGLTYGGHVYAQAVWAASQTVAKELVVHNVHGYFTLPGLADRPLIYQVSHISEVRSYSTRLVTVRQPTSPSTSPTGFQLSDGDKELGNICFTSMCSFKRDSGTGQPTHQVTKNLEAEYSSVLKGKKPWDHPCAPGADAPWYFDLSDNQRRTDLFPGLRLHKVDMSAYNPVNSPLLYRQLQYYRAYGALPSSLPNLHACAHLYASDRNSLYLISHALDVDRRIAKIGSLSHSVVFHVDKEELLFQGVGEGEDGVADGNWFVQEAWTPRSQGGRGVHESTIWDARAVHVASSWQDGLVRVKGGVGEPKL